MSAITFMSVSRAIAHNTLIHLAGKTVSLFLGMAAIGVMTRTLGSDGYGVYVTAYAFMHFFGMLADFGLTLTAVQLLADDRRDKSRVMNGLVSFRVVTAALFLLAGVALAWFMPYAAEIKTGVWFCALAFGATNLIQVITTLFQSQLRIYKVTLAETLSRALYFAVVVLLAVSDFSLFWYWGALAGEGALYLLLLMIFAGRYVKWRWSWDWELWREITRRTWPIALSISFNLIYLRMDTVILSLTRGAAEVGLYGAAYKIVDVLTMMAALFMGLLLPQLIKAYLKKETESLARLLQNGFDALVVFSLPVILGTWAVAERLMVAFAGAEFTVAGDYLRVLILAAGVIFVTSLFSYGVVAIDKQKQLMWGFLVTAIITLTGYLLTIPLYGASAAAWWTVFSEVLVLGWSFTVVHRATGFRPNLTVFWRSVPAALVMFGLATRGLAWPLWVLIPLCAVVYFALLILFGGIKKQTLKELFGKSV